MKGREKASKGVINKTLSRNYVTCNEGHLSGGVRNILSHKTIVSEI